MINLFLGDARFFWPENIIFLRHIPFAWDASLNTGIGISQVNTLWITSYLNFTSLFTFFGLPWFLITIIFWIIPIIVIAFLSSFFLYKTYIHKSNLQAALAGIIFTTNTYFLSIFFGGQFGVSFSYAFIPLVFLGFISTYKQKNLYSSVLAGFVLSLQVLFDPRIASLTVASAFFYYLFGLRFSKKDLLYLMTIPLAVVLFLHIFWILPLLINTSAIIPHGFISLPGVKFLSFAVLENTLSLLHPNWPENIFGKVYFMRPEFLLIPITAFTSLLFLKKEETERKKNILFFSLLALFSSFLAKGTNEPFGGIFVLFVKKVPGFSIFRDATKFYSLIALSYCILVPFSLWKMSEKVRKYLRFFQAHFLVFTFFFLFWLFSLRLLRTNHNIFTVHQVPGSYIQLKNFLVSQNQFFRTLWIPSWQRYGFFSDIHPAIGRGELFKEASPEAMVQQLKKSTSQGVLKNMSVKYVIVPEDSEGELFLNDRKYDKKTYEKTVSDIQRIAWLTKVKTFGKIVVFEVSNPHDRFWSPSSTLGIYYNFLNPTEYIVSVKNAKRGDVLIFTEGFDQRWTIESSKFKVQSSKFNTMLNSFVLPENGSYTFHVHYQPQTLVTIGLIISGITFTTIILYLGRYIRFKK